MGLRIMLYFALILQNIFSSQELLVFKTRVYVTFFSSTNWLPKNESLNYHLDFSFFYLILLTLISSLHKITLTFITHLISLDYDWLDLASLFLLHFCFSSSFFLHPIYCLLVKLNFDLCFLQLVQVSKAKPLSFLCLPQSWPLTS